MQVAMNLAAGAAAAPAPPAPGAGPEAILAPDFAAEEATAKGSKFGDLLCGVLGAMAPEGAPAARETSHEVVGPATEADPVSDAVDEAAAALSGLPVEGPQPQGDEEAATDEDSAAEPADLDEEVALAGDAAAVFGTTFSGPSLLEVLPGGTVAGAPAAQPEAGRPASPAAAEPALARPTGGPGTDGPLDPAAGGASPSGVEGAETTPGKRGVSQSGVRADVTAQGGPAAQPGASVTPVADRSLNDAAPREAPSALTDDGQARPDGRAGVGPAMPGRLGQRSAEWAATAQRDSGAGLTGDGTSGNRDGALGTPLDGHAGILPGPGQRGELLPFTVPGSAVGPFGTAAHLTGAGNASSGFAGSSSSAGTALAAGEEVSESGRLTAGRLVRAARLILRTDGGTARVLLEPPSLGTVTLEIAVRDRAVSAALQTQSRQATEAVNSHLPALRQALERQGLTIDRLDVSTEEPPADGLQTDGQAPDWSLDRWWQWSWGTAPHRRLSPAGDAPAEELDPAAAEEPAVTAGWVMLDVLA